MPSGLDFLPIRHSANDGIRKSTGPPRFTDFVIEHWRVARFVRKCIYDILPLEILGSKHNVAVVNAGTVPRPHMRGNGLTISHSGGKLYRGASWRDLFVGNCHARLQNERLCVE